MKDTLAGFIDNVGLADAFNVQHDDPHKARKPLLDGIRRMRDQFAARNGDTSKAANRWWQIKNGVLAMTVKIGGETLQINGATTNHLPVDRFEEFLEKFEQAVDSGAFDDELKAKGIGRARAQQPSNGKSKIIDTRIGGRHPSNDREDWDDLTWAQRQQIGAYYRAGKNPDGTVIAKVGYRPDAPLAD
ncbi:hypothetical protein ACLBWH_07795 [Sphingomonas sp. M6A6_1c]|jgi:hypothetical protein|nr:MAG: hypothetical protein EOP66_04670 [Sphingomonas sp.]